MVQRHGDDDLIRRFSRVEQVKLERRRREKIEPTRGHPQEMLSGNDRCRRVLFEPDTNLQGWIDGELGKIAENKKLLWNFDFTRGVPAGIQGHPWKWQRYVPPPPPTAPPPTSAPVAVAAAANPSQKIPAPWAKGIGSSSQSTSAKIAKRSAKQKKITDYMNPRKYPKTAKTAKTTAEPTADSSGLDDENAQTLSTGQSRV